eukprot:COSAG01_NODE_301_length_19211_cov_21.838478_12_plen_59_part_00
MAARPVNKLAAVHAKTRHSQGIRGRVTEIDKDHAGNTLWQTRYEVDGKEDDYDKFEMI